MNTSKDQHLASQQLLPKAIAICSKQIGQLEREHPVRLHISYTQGLG